MQGNLDTTKATIETDLNKRVLRHIMRTFNQTAVLVLSCCNMCCPAKLREAVALLSCQIT
jgi:hypothetical protein